MPSHAGEELTPLYGSAKFDFTELDFSDNLLNPTGVIKEAEKLLAKSYGSDDCLIFTCGATSAIWSAFAVIKETGDSVLVDSFSHKSVFAALRNFSLDAEILKRGYDDEGFPKKLTANDIEDHLKEKKFAAVAVTSPDYFGNVLDIKEIAEVCHRYGAMLFVDEAQGAHFAFSSLLPINAARYADLAVDSLHKTLPVYGGGAVLNVKKEFAEIAAVCRAKINTSSPSYVIMASIDYARAYYDEVGEDGFLKLKEKTDEIKIRLLGRVKNTDDFSRLVVKASENDLIKYGFYPEMSYGEYCVFILNFQNMKHVDELVKILENQSKFGDKISGEKLNAIEIPKILSKSCGKKGFVSLCSAEGKIAATDVGCYPPGVPLIFEGERVTKEKIEFLKNKNAFNLVNNKIYVIMDTYGENYARNDGDV